MSTYQVEEYYVHVKTTNASKETLEKVRVLLIENDWGDHEFAGDDLTVDGFESEADANYCDDIIGEYLQFH